MLRNSPFAAFKDKPCARQTHAERVVNEQSLPLRRLDKCTHEIPPFYTILSIASRRANGSAHKPLKMHVRGCSRQHSWNWVQRAIQTFTRCNSKPSRENQTNLRKYRASRMKCQILDSELGLSRNLDLIFSTEIQHKISCGN